MCDITGRLHLSSIQMPTKGSNFLLGFTTCFWQHAKHYCIPTCCLHAEGSVLSAAECGFLNQVHLRSSADDNVDADAIIWPLESTALVAGTLRSGTMAQEPKLLCSWSWNAGKVLVFIKIPLPTKIWFKNSIIWQTRCDRDICRVLCIQLVKIFSRNCWTWCAGIMFSPSSGYLSHITEEGL